MSDQGFFLMVHGNVKFSPNFTTTGLVQLNASDSPLAETLEKGNHANEKNKEKLSVDYCPVFVDYSSSSLKLISG